MKNLNKIRTEYVWTNHWKCTACWKCIESCPGQVIGKAGFLWHRHIVIENAAECVGCKKCIQTCPRGVFFQMSNVY